MGNLIVCENFQGENRNIPVILLPMTLSPKNFIDPQNNNPLLSYMALQTQYDLCMPMIE